jgi:hypothetical protein
MRVIMNHFLKLSTILFATGILLSASNAFAAEKTCEEFALELKIFLMGYGDSEHRADEKVAQMLSECKQGEIKK